jgi:hypothetical protein
VPQFLAVWDGIAATSSDFDRFPALAAMMSVAADFTCPLILLQLKKTIRGFKDVAANLS